jgi:cytoskeletal protein CcmA (bactofilin family)
MFGRSKKQTPITGKIDTLIAKSATVHGDVEFSGGLHLEGRVVGNVRGGALAPIPGASSDPCTLWISEPGTVEGTVDVPSVVINGSVIGDVIARERVVIGPHARISGNVQYGAIEMALGGEVSGKLVPMGPATAGQAALTGPSSANLSGNVTPLPTSAAFDARKVGA